MLEFYPERFNAAAEYYIRGRPKYAPALIDSVAKVLKLKDTDGVLDLGTGPGILAVDFSRYSSNVTAVDPSLKMLAIGKEYAKSVGAQVNFVQGSSFDLSPHLGYFHLTTIGRAFHWMDRPATLRSLDRLTDSTGAVVIFSESFPIVFENNWRTAFQNILSKYSMHDSPEIADLTHVSHEQILVDSPFSAIEYIEVIDRYATPVASFVDRILSYGSVWTNASASLVSDVRNDIYNNLSKYAIDGIIAEVIKNTAIVATRPGI